MIAIDRDCSLVNGRDHFVFMPRKAEHSRLADVDHESARPRVHGEAARLRSRLAAEQWQHEKHKHRFSRNHHASKLMLRRRGWRGGIGYRPGPLPNA
jgi:hypothetical protein